MGTVYQWIQNLSVWLVLSAVILHLVPGKDYGKYVRFFSGMVLLLLFLEPMLKLTGTDGMITKLYEGNLAKEDQAEKIAPAKTRISYTDDKGKSHNMWETGNTTLILTYDRATGGFRQIQTEAIRQEKILEQLAAGKDIAFHDSGSYCRSITIAGGGSTKRIDLNKEAGTYTVVNVKTGQ